MSRMGHQHPFVGGHRRIGLTNADDRMPVREESNVVVEDASPMEQRQREPEERLKALLEGEHCRSLFVAQLLKDIILAKGEHRHETRAIAHSYLDEPQSSPESQVCRPWLRFETLCRTANDNGDAVPFALSQNPLAASTADGA